MITERMLDMGDSLSMDDVRRVVHTVKDMGDDEQLVLTLNSQDSYKAQNIFSVLERNNFEWATKGSHDGRDYYIIAKRKQGENGGR